MSTQNDSRFADASRRLAEAHFTVEPVITRIHRLETNDPSDATIRLLEVNPGTFPSGIVPVGFGPNSATGVPYPSVIIEVTPGEYAAVASGELNLPDGWRLGDEYSRPDVGDPRRREPTSP